MVLSTQLVTIPIRLTPGSVIDATRILQCAFLHENGKRCKKKSITKLKLHLENKFYKYPVWVEVNLCSVHYVHFGGKF